MGIFDFLDFADLAVMATLRPRYQQIIIDHYILPKYQLQNAEISIILSQFYYHTNIHYKPTKDTPDSDKLVTGHNQVLSTLKAFCPLFGRITFHTGYYFPDDLTMIKQVSSVINKHCSNVPQELFIELTEEDLDFTFENATIVHLDSPKHYTTQQLNRCFPRMEMLSIRIGLNITPDPHLPHLTHFELKQIFDGQFDMKTFGANNPQLRGLTMKLPWGIDQMQEIAENFPNLEVLDIQLHRIKKKPSFVDKMSSLFGTFFTREVKEIRFPNLKSVTINISKMYYYKQGVDYSFDIIHADWIRDRLSVIKFDQLESFTLITHSQTLVEEQIDLITANTGLKNVDLSSISLNFEQMQRLVGNLPDLKVVKLKCYKPETVGDIRRIMEMKTSLEAIIVVVNVERRTGFLELPSLPGDWNIDTHQMTSSYHLRFERRERD